MMLTWEMRSYDEAQHFAGVVLFDRGVPDVEGYLRLMQLPVPPHVRNAVQRYRYNPLVFIAPPWREIFRQDAERKQTFDEAVRTHDALAQTYESHATSWSGCHWLQCRKEPDSCWIESGADPTRQPLSGISGSTSCMSSVSDSCHPR